MIYVYLSFSDLHSFFSANIKPLKQGLEVEKSRREGFLACECSCPQLWTTHSTSFLSYTRTILKVNYSSSRLAVVATDDASLKYEPDKVKAVQSLPWGKLGALFTSSIPYLDNPYFKGKTTRQGQRSCCVLIYLQISIYFWNSDFIWVFWWPVLQYYKH